MTPSRPGTVLYDAASTPPAIGLSDYHDNAALITPEIQALLDTALAGLEGRDARSVRADQVHGERQLVSALRSQRNSPRGGRKTASRSFWRTFIMRCTPDPHLPS